MAPIDAFGIPVSKSSVDVITIGTLFVNLPVVDENSKIPQSDSAVSNQYESSAASPTGLAALAVKAAKSTSMDS